MLLDTDQPHVDCAFPLSSRRPLSLIELFYFYAQPDLLGIAIYIQLIASSIYLFDDAAYSFQWNIFHNATVNLLNLGGAVLFAIDSVLYYIAYRISRQQHHNGHSNDDQYDICTGRIDSRLGVTAYMANILGSVGYVVSSCITIQYNDNVIHKVYSDIATNYIDTINMLCFCISAFIFVYIWILDESTCTKAMPLDQTIVSNVCDTIASTLCIIVLLYGLITRVYLQQHTTINNKQSAYDYQGEIRYVGTKQHRYYVVSDIIYVISTVALLVDYCKRKHQYIQENYYKLVNDKQHKLRSTDELQCLLSLESQGNSYGAANHVEAISLDPTQQFNGK